MSKVISFEPRVGKAQTGQTSGGFTAIKPFSFFFFVGEFHVRFDMANCKSDRVWIGQSGYRLKIGRFKSVKNEFESIGLCVE